MKRLKCIILELKVKVEIPKEIPKILSCHYLYIGLGMFGVLFFMWGGKIPLMSVGGKCGHIKHAQTVSEDPQRCEQNFRLKTVVSDISKFICSCPNPQLVGV